MSIVCDGPGGFENLRSVSAIAHMNRYHTGKLTLGANYMRYRLSHFAQRV